ncbi:hypothetical protein CDAR_105071 [Caerostris darwini]|uniref:Uncharacterized protein n=1 Tax=Caerostris darwini TaxID=1538125 RepID=A0AAV4V4W1_9ARAC|nr:hypothetical protein CDAR_105071 [Caerostris darwini]
MREKVASLNYPGTSRESSSSPTLKDHRSKRTMLNPPNNQRYEKLSPPSRAGIRGLLQARMVFHNGSSFDWSEPVMMGRGDIDMILRYV